MTCLTPATLAALAGAVEIRVATFNIGARFEDGSSEFSLGAPGTPDHDTVRDILRRIDADVVALQEIHTADTAGSPDHLDALAASAGYPHIHLPAFTSLDFTFRTAILSRHPFRETTTISSPAGANELTRRFPAVVVDMPGTERDPLVVTAHLKAGTRGNDRFRRAVEMRRLANHLAAENQAGTDNFVILGDFNLSSHNLTFTGVPEDLPNSYSLGDDITFPVVYSNDPAAYFPAPPVVRLDPRHLDGSAGTFDTRHTAGPTLDLILVSPAIAGRPLAAEIYNSTLDASNASGLPKWGNPLSAETSSLASDHYAVFADLELDGDYPELALAASSAVAMEGEPLELTVTLPAPRAVSVLVTLASDDPAAIPEANPLEIPAGATSAGAGMVVARNYLADPPRTVTFAASAAGYDAGTATVEIHDGDGPYVFTTPGETITESFDGFRGGHAPAPWTSAGAPWIGTDDGSGTAAGFRSYRTGSGGSAGHLGNENPAEISAVFSNSTGATLSAIDISYVTRQWRPAAGGTADRITAALVHGGAIHPLEELAAETSASLSQSLEVAIPPGDSFELRIGFVPGTGGGPPPAEVFVNECHYDNAGADVGEFVEIVVGPGFAGESSDVALHLYNGANGQTYGSHPLDGFEEGEPSGSGHRILWKAIAGIQNGAPDGFALVVGGEVRQFLSYEGTFTASAGPAAGLTSVDIGVSQTGSEPASSSSLGLAGAGGVSADFVWTEFAGLPHTPGQPNPGQSFTAPPAAQGLAIEEVAVTAIAANPLVDSDGDGQPDADEWLFGTDPADPASRYAPAFVRENGVLQLAVPTLEGRGYVLETSEDLAEWSVLASFSGTGEVHRVPAEGTTPRFFRVRVTLAAP